MESHFTKIPSYLPVPDGKGHWVSKSTLEYYSEMLGYKIIVPAGSVNDLASIPRFFTRVFPVNASHRIAAAMHDYLYENRGLISGVQHSRKTCDKLFLEAMSITKDSYYKALSLEDKEMLIAVGLAKEFAFNFSPLVNPTTAKLMYYGLRIGGSFDR